MFLPELKLGPSENDNAKCSTRNAETEKAYNAELSTTHSKRILPKWVEYGGMLGPMKRDLRRYSENLYYRGSLHKFFAFLLHGDFERVVVMDADGVPLSDLDHLFLLPLPENVSLAAPGRSHPLADISVIFFLNYV